MIYAGDPAFAEHHMLPEVDITMDILAKIYKLPVAYNFCPMKTILKISFPKRFLHRYKIAKNGMNHLINNVPIIINVEGIYREKFGKREYLWVTEN